MILLSLPRVECWFSKGNDDLLKKSEIEEYEREMTYGSIYQEFCKIKGQRNQDFRVATKLFRTSRRISLKK